MVVESSLYALGVDDDSLIDLVQRLKRLAYGVKAPLYRI
jgi:hypothetical protein